MLMEAPHILCNCACYTTRPGQSTVMTRIMIMCVCMFLRRVNIYGEMALTPAYPSVARIWLPAGQQTCIQNMNCSVRLVNTNQERLPLRSPTRMVGAGIHRIPWDRQQILAVMNLGEPCLGAGWSCLKTAR